MLTEEDFVDLGDALKQAGFKIATHQYLSAQRIAVALTTQSASPADRLRISSYLAPVFCTKPEEQARFEKVYLDWLSRRRGIPITDRVFPGESSRTPKSPWPWWKWLATVLTTIMILSGSWWAWQEWKPRHVIGMVQTDTQPLEGVQVQLGSEKVLTGSDGRFRFPFQIRAVPATISLEKAGFVSKTRAFGEDLLASQKRFYFGRFGFTSTIDLGTVDLQKAENRTPPEPIARTLDPIVLKDDSTTGEMRVEPIARIDLREVITIPPIWKRIVWMHVALASIPLLAGSCWYLFRKRKQPVLQRMTSTTPPALREVHLEQGIQHLFPSFQFRRLAQTMRSRRLILSTELDPTRTVQATAGRGGIFSPVYGSREEPGYVALIDRMSTIDHHARLALQVTADLMKSEVLLEPVEFDRDPTTLRRVEYGRRLHKHGDAPVVAAATIQAITLEALQAQYPARRLLLFADAAICFNRLTGATEPWLETMAGWEERYLITAEPVEQWTKATWVLERKGFKVIPFSPLGFALLTAVLQSGLYDKLDRSGHAPFYQRTTEQWLERYEPKPGIVGRLCSELEQDLGREGFLWLCACAAYPEIHWGLTLRLGVALIQDQEKLELGLPKLSRMIWFREGFMPDWLRAALLKRLESNDLAQVRTALTEILSSLVTGDEKALPLMIATDSKKESWFSWRKRQKDLQNLAREAPASSPFRDYVFLATLSGKSLNNLSPIAPTAFMRAMFPDGQRWLGLRPCVVMAILLCFSLLLGTFKPPFVPIRGTPYSVKALFPTIDGFGLVTEAFVLGEAKLVSRNARGAYKVEFEIDPMSYVEIVQAGLSSPISAIDFSMNQHSISFATKTGEVLSANPDAKDPKLYSLYTAKNHAVQAIALNQSKPLLAIADSEGITLISHNNGQAEGPLAQLPIVQARAVAFSPDGNLLATVSEVQGTTLWDIQTDKPHQIASTSSAGIRVISFNQDGSFLAEGAEDGSIHVRSSNSGKEVRQLKQGSSSVVDLKFAPVLNLLAAIDSDGAVRVWDASTFNLLHTMQSESGPNGKLAFNTEALKESDVFHLLSVGDNSIAQVWQIPKKKSSSNARSIALLAGNNYREQPYALRGPIVEVKFLEPELKRLGYQVVRREDTSREQLRDDFRSLSRQLQPNDTLVLYLTGHGAKDEKTGFAFMGTGGKPPDIAHDGVKGEEIAEFFLTIPVKQALLVVNASNSRSLANMPRRNEDAAQSSRVRMILSSYTSGQPVESPNGGPFARALALSLHDLTEPTNGYDLTKRVARRMALEGPNQTPAYEPFLAAGHTGGDFQFVVPMGVAPSRAKPDSVNKTGGPDTILEKSTSNPADMALRSPGDQSSGSTFGSSSRRLPTRGFAFYSSDKQRYFKLVNGDPFADPKNGDLVEAIGKVNARKGYIQLKPEKGGWINQKAIGRIEPGDRLRVLDIYRPVESFIWIEYELVDGSRRNQNFRSNSPQNRSNQVTPQSLAPKDQPPTPAPGGNDINAAPQLRPSQGQQLEFDKQRQPIQQQQIEPEIVPPTEQKAPNTDQLPPSKPSNLRAF